jgi:hypothetical protein
MCHSAHIRADSHQFVRAFGAQVDLREFARLYWERKGGGKAKVPEAMDAPFAPPRTADKRQPRALIDACD